MLPVTLWGPLLKRHAFRGKTAGSGDEHELSQTSTNTLPVMLGHALARAAEKGLSSPPISSTLHNLRGWGGGLGMGMSPLPEFSKSLRFCLLPSFNRMGDFRPKRRVSSLTLCLPFDLSSFHPKI